MPKKDDLPDTLRRSPPKAQRTWKKTHDNAVKQYGEGERAHRTAFNSLKQKFEKVGNRWQSKNGKSASDPRMKQKSTAARRKGKGQTYGGIDIEGNSRTELMERAKRLGIQGRSNMNKEELAKAISQKQG